MNRYGKLLALVLALMMLMMPLSAHAEEGAPEVGDPAPGFDLTQIDGEAFHLSDHLGKVVFLNVWATWCPPCVAEIPDIQKLSEAHPDDLVVIGVSLDEKESDVVKFVGDNGITYPIAMDDGYLVAGKLYPTMYIPESVFIAPDGTIASVDVGGLTYEDMEARYSAAKGE